MWLASLGRNRKELLRLMAVQRPIGRIKSEDNLRGRDRVRFQEQVDHTVRGVVPVCNVTVSARAAWRNTMYLRG